MGVRTLFEDTINLGDFGEYDFSAKKTKSKFDAFAQMAKIEIDQMMPVKEYLIQFFNQRIVDIPRDMFEIKFDHPFVFIIYDQQFDNILFAGTINRPI